MNPDTIKDTYVRTHWVVVAKYDRLLDNALAMRHDILTRVTPQMMQERQVARQTEYERIIKDDDHEAMQQYIQRVRDHESTKNNREFDYLFPDGRP